MEKVDEETGKVLIVKKKKGKGRAKVSNNSQADGQSSIGSLSNNDIKNIFQQGIKSKMAKSKKKHRKTVVNDTPQEQEKKMKMA